MLGTLAACKKTPDDNGASFDIDSTTPSTSFVEEASKPENATAPQTEEGALKGTPFTIPADKTGVETNFELNQNSPASTASQFILAVATNQYKALSALMNMENSPFISETDFNFAIPRSKYSTIADHAGKTVYTSVSDVQKEMDVAQVRVALCSEDGKELASFDLNLVLNKENKWVVEDPDLYEVNYHVIVPGGSALTIDGQAVDRSYFVRKTGINEQQELYIIKAIGKANKELRVTSEAFDLAIEAMPSSNNEETPAILAPKLEDGELDEALNAVKDMWNSMYQEFVAGSDGSKLLQYFSSTANSSYANDVISSFKLIGERGQYVEHAVRGFQKNPEKECVYITDKAVFLNFTYDISASSTVIKALDSDENRESNIILTKEDGTYKIALISDMELFSKRI